MCDLSLASGNLIIFKVVLGALGNARAHDYKEIPLFQHIEICQFLAD